MSDMFDRLGTFYNAIPGTSKKKEVEDWAVQAYPLIWQELVTFGQATTLDGDVLFNLERSVAA